MESKIQYYYENVINRYNRGRRFEFEAIVLVVVVVLVVVAATADVGEAADRLRSER